MKKKPQWPDAGFSIPQILVALTLFSILVLGYLNFIQFALKGQKNVQNSVDFDVLKTSLTLVFNSRACDEAFLALDGTPLSFTFPSPITANHNLAPVGSPILIGQINFGPGVKLIKMGETVAGGLTVSELSIVSAIYDGIHTYGTVTYHAYSSLVKITATKSTGSLGGQTLTTQIAVRLLARITAPNVGKVEKCGYPVPIVVNTGEPRTAVPSQGFSVSNTKFPAVNYVAPDTNYAEAANRFCAARTPVGRLCTETEWIAACSALSSSTNDPLGFFTGAPERNTVAGMCHGGTVNGTSCTSWSVGSNCNITSEPQPFRCCFTP